MILGTINAYDDGHGRFVIELDQFHGTKARDFLL
jgi:hypothetical protein